MRTPVRTIAALLALALAGAGSGAIAMPARPPLGEAQRLVDAALAIAGAATSAATAVASTGLAQLGRLVRSYGLEGLAASPTMLVGFLVGLGASLVALLLVLVLAATRPR